MKHELLMLIWLTYSKIYVPLEFIVADLTHFTYWPENCLRWFLDAGRILQLKLRCSMRTSWNVWSRIVTDCRRGCRCWKRNRCDVTQVVSVWLLPAHQKFKVLVTSVCLFPLSAEVKRQAGKTGSTGQMTPNTFYPLQKHKHNCIYLNARWL